MLSMLCPVLALIVLTLSSTIAAGDTLIAGMLFGLICRDQSWSLDCKLQFANELAGRKVIQEGLHGLGRLMRHLI